MKVYMFNWNCGNWGAGVMLIAAENQINAEQIALNSSSNDSGKYWEFDREMPELEYKGDTQCVIIESSYQE